MPAESPFIRALPSRTPEIDFGLRRHGRHVRPVEAHHSRVAAATGVLVVAVPLTLTLAGSSEAAPTLTVAQAQVQLASLQTREAQATEAYDAGVITLQKATKQSAAAGRAVSVQSTRLSGMEKGIAAFAAASYTTGGLNPVDSLLAGGDPQQLIARAAGVNEVARSNDASLTQIAAQRELLATAQQTATAQAVGAQQALTALTAAKNRILTVIAQEQGVYSHMQTGQRTALLAQQATGQAAAAQTATQSAAAPASVAAPTASGSVAAALAAAYSQLGKPYVYGAAGPGAYDCSGLVMWAFAHAGISLPHSAAGQYGYGTRVPASQLQPGDLVFFDEGGSIGHVGIYVGGGSMIDANHGGGWVGIRPLYSGLIGGTRL